MPKPGLKYYNSVNRTFINNVLFIDCKMVVHFLYLFLCQYESTPIQNISKLLPPVGWEFSDGDSGVFRISAQNLGCGC